MTWKDTIANAMPENPGTAGFSIPVKLPIDEIEIDSIGLRSEVNKDDERYKGLVASMDANGLMNSINVRKLSTGKFAVIDGLHRFTAAKELGWTEISTNYFPNVKPEEVAYRQIVGNFHRLETRPVEFRDHLRRILSSEPMLTQTELANRLSMPPSMVSSLLSLDKLTPKAEKLVASGKVAAANAYFLARLEDPEEQDHFLERAQTLPANEFGALVNERKQQLNRQKRALRDTEQVGEHEFQPVMRKTAEIKAKFAELARLLRDTPPEDREGILQNNSLDFQVGMFMGIAYTLKLDPATLEQRKAAFEAEEAERARKKAEKTGGKATSTSVQEVIGLKGAVTAAE